MFIRVSLIAGAIFAMAPLALRADTLNGTGGSWQTWSAASLYGGTAPTPGVPYWNNSSGDGPDANIGWCLVGGGPTCNLATTYGTLPYFGTTPTTGANSVADMYFTSSGAPINLSVLGIHTNETVAGQYNIFGYYVVPASGSPTLKPLFSTWSGSFLPSTATLSLTAGTNYGFYLENIQGGGGPAESDFFFYMNSALDNSVFNHGAPSALADTSQHFAVFQSSAGYIIGDVDGYACPVPSDQGGTPCIIPSEFDYNDVIVGTSPVPEPATMGLIAVSLLLAGAVVRRNRAA